MPEKIKVLGGPGCGKSYTLMQKYDFLFNSGYKPQDITLITFRKSSAEDLINVVAMKTGLPEKILKQHVGTIHSICWRLGGHKEVISKQESDNFVKEYGYSAYMNKKAAIDEEDTAYSGNLFDLYTWLRNTCTPYERWVKYPGIGEVLLPNNQIPEFLHNYDEYKQKIGKIDFSDMIQNILKDKIDLDTPVLMMDEFQDLTAQMYELFKMWSPKREIAMIAGDPFQSIYGFWGGSPDYFNAWEAKEIIIGETRRLPEQIQEFASKILRIEGMITPEVKAKQGYKNPIYSIPYGSDLPTYNTELHLIRCNYQADAIAMNLAKSGKIFGGLRGWTKDEMNLANAILAYRSGKLLSKDDIKTIVSAYPIKLYGAKATEEEVLKQIDKKYTTDLRANANLLKPVILDSMLSGDPTAKMVRNNKLLTLKIQGILRRKAPILPWETATRKILTMHGSKGLEADAVFLHTAITPRINRAIIIPSEESAAEARVWYVGATRAKEVLYLVRDAGKNYSLPEVYA